MPDLFDAIAQTTRHETIKSRGTLLLTRADLVANPLLIAHVTIEPWCFHRASRQGGHTHELDNVLGRRVSENALDLRMRVTFFRHRERRAELHARRTCRKPAPHRRMPVD